MYPGIKLPRVQGKEYEEFIEEFMQAVTHKWGKQTLIQFEDFGNHNAFKVPVQFSSLLTLLNSYCESTRTVT